MPSAMRQDSVGWGPVARGSPSPRRGPVQAPGRPVREEEHRQKLEALRPELGGKRLRSHKLRCWARPEGPPAHWGHQETQSPCSPEGHGPRALAAASQQVKSRSSRLALQERPPESHSAGQQTCQPVEDARLQVPEPAGEGLVLPRSTCSRLLEQNARLQRALEDLERQRSALEMENRLLKKRSSPEARKEAERLQQKNARLAALTEQLNKRCRHLQDTIEHLMNTPVPLPIQSSAEDQGVKFFPQHRAGERREPAGVLRAQAQQKELSQKADEELQAQLAAGNEGSYGVSTLRQKCAQLQRQLMEMADKNTRLAEENSHLRGQMRWAEKVQAENADLKGQLTRVAEERNSVLQAIGSLQTRLKDAERKLEAMTEMAEGAQAVAKREHQDTMPLFQANTAHKIVQCMMTLMHRHSSLQ